MNEQGAVPLIVMARSQDHVEAINSTLRKAGHPVHCTWLPDADWLASACDVAVIVTVFGFGTVSGAI